MYQVFTVLRLWSVRVKETVAGSDKSLEIDKKSLEISKESLESSENKDSHWSPGNQQGFNWKQPGFAWNRQGFAIEIGQDSIEIGMESLEISSENKDSIEIGQDSIEIGKDSLEIGKDSIEISCKNKNLLEISKKSLEICKESLDIGSENKESQKFGSEDKKLLKSGSEIVTKSLEFAVNNLDVPIRGGTDLVEEFLANILDIVAVADSKPNCRILLEKLFEENSRVSWKLKSKYPVLNVLIPRIGVENVLRNDPEFGRGLFKSLGANHLSSAGVAVYKTILKSMSLPDWKTHFLEPLIEALSEQNRYLKLF